MRLRTWMMLALAAVAVVRCTSTSTKSADTGMAMPMAADPAAVRQAIDSLNNKFVAAFKANDTTTMMANYADDALMLMSGSPAWRGKAEIAKGFSGLLADMKASEFGFTTGDVLVSGDLAVENGTFHMTVTPKGGKAMEDKGNYVTVWKKQADGSWKIVRDVGVSEPPPTK